MAVDRIQRMELRHIRYFLAVAETLNFGRAAARLGIAQPPLSVQIRDLERELGTPLFHRGPKGVSLTDAGNAFAPRAAAILSAADEAAEAARDAAAGRGGRLVVGFVHSLAYSLLPGLLPSYRQAFPGVAVSLREVEVTNKEEALLSGAIDVGLYRPPPRHPEIDSETLGDERMIVALPSEHPLARRRSVPPEALREQPLVLYPPARGDAGLYGTISAYLRRFDIPAEPAEVAGTIHTALGLVLAGAGLTIVPESSARLRLRGIAFRPFDGPQPSVRVCVSWRHRDGNRLTTAFVQHVKALAPALLPVR